VKRCCGGKVIKVLRTAAPKKGCIALLKSIFQCLVAFLREKLPDCKSHCIKGGDDNNFLLISVGKGVLGQSSCTGIKHQKHLILVLSPRQGDS
jgi:hypothetical protein